MDCTRQHALAWIRTVVNRHLPGNARQFKWSCYTPDHILRTNLLGMAVDHAPQRGKVVELDEHWLLLKTGRNQFYVFARALLAVVPDLGDEVCITTYARRRFDGARLDAAEEDVQGGVTFVAHKIGQRVSSCPSINPRCNAATWLT